MSKVPKKLIEWVCLHLPVPGTTPLTITRHMTEAFEASPTIRMLELPETRLSQLYPFLVYK